MDSVRNREEWEAKKSAEAPICALFTADSCIDCRIIKPILPELEEQYKGRLDFFKVDREEYPEIYQEESVNGIPSFIIFKGGKEIHRWVSTLRKTRDEIEEFLDEGVRRSNES